MSFVCGLRKRGKSREAFKALQQVLPHASQYVLREQLEILPASKWYLTAGVFDAEKSFVNGTARCRTAEANGFVGARTTGNPFWLQSEEDWHQFLTYEHTVHEAIETQRVISLCTYPAAICSARDMISTFASHHAILTYQGDSWQCLDVRRRQATA